MGTQREREGREGKGVGTHCWRIAQTDSRVVYYSVLLT